MGVIDSPLLPKSCPTPFKYSAWVSREVACGCKGFTGTSPRRGCTCLHMLILKVSSSSNLSWLCSSQSTAGLALQIRWRRNQLRRLFRSMHQSLLPNRRFLHHTQQTRRVVVVTGQFLSTKNRKYASASNRILLHGPNVYKISYGSTTGYLSILSVHTFRTLGT
jgi:hypothetical protein